MIAVPGCSWITGTAISPQLSPAAWNKWNVCFWRPTFDGVDGNFEESRVVMVLRNKNPAKFDMDKLKRCHNLQKGTPWYFSMGGMCLLQISHLLSGYRGRPPLVDAPKWSISVNSCQGFPYISYLWGSSCLTHLVATSTCIVPTFDLTYPTTYHHKLLDIMYFYTVCICVHLMTYALSMSSLQSPSWRVRGSLPSPWKRSTMSF